MQCTSVPDLQPIRRNHILWGALKRIGRYLAGTMDKGLILNPRSNSFECFVDADFIGNWDRVNADIDPSTAKSRTGYVIMYGGCPMVWASKLQ
jgi:hypothetical protein